MVYRISLNGLDCTGGKTKHALRLQMVAHTYSIDQPYRQDELCLLAVFVHLSYEQYLRQFCVDFVEM